MVVLTKWKVPQAAAEHALRRELEKMRSLRWRYLMWWLLLGGPTLYVVYRLDPSSLTRTAIGIAVCMAWLPLVVYISLRSGSSPTYELNEKGLLRRSSSHLYNWKQIQGYRFGDDPDLPGLRCFEFKAWSLYGSKWRIWHFDPSEVDESLLRSILEEHLPGKCLDNMPEGSD